MTELDECIKMVYERIAALLPERFKRWVARQLEYAGINVNAGRFAGFVMAFT